MSITDITTTQLDSAAEGPCPTWCAGSHTKDGEHLAATCPAWCTGHPGCEDEMTSWGPDGAVHTSGRTEVILSLAGPTDGAGTKHPDYIQTSVWRMADAAAPVVAVMHGAKDEYLPDMTPAEAMALAADLVRAAGTAASEVAAPAGTSCPPWCAYSPCGPFDLPHISWASTAPVTEHVFCSGMRDREDETDRTAAACEEGNVAELMLGGLGGGYDGPVVVLRHGDDVLPYMPLEAAEELALGILELVSAARTPSPGK